MPLCKHVYILRDIDLLVSWNPIFVSIFRVQDMQRKYKEHDIFQKNLMASSLF